jgi:hypothetical protein
LGNQINIQPNFWTAATTIQTRMREIDKHLSEVMKRRIALDDIESVLAIKQFREKMGVPAQNGTLSQGVGEGMIRIEDVDPLSETYGAIYDVPIEDYQEGLDSDGTLPERFSVISGDVQ